MDVFCIFGTELYGAGVPGTMIVRSSVHLRGHRSQFKPTFETMEYLSAALHGDDMLLNYLLRCQSPRLNHHKCVVYHVENTAAHQAILHSLDR